MKIPMEKMKILLFSNHPDRKMKLDFEAYEDPMSKNFMKLSKKYIKRILSLGKEFVVLRNEAALLFVSAETPQENL